MPLSRKQHVTLQFSSEISGDEAFDIFRAILSLSHELINLIVFDLVGVIIVLCLAIFSDHVDVEDFIWIHSNFLSLLKRLMNLSRFFGLSWTLCVMSYARTIRSISSALSVLFLWLARSLFFTFWIAMFEFTEPLRRIKLQRKAQFLIFLKEDK